MPKNSAKTKLDIIFSRQLPRDPVTKTLFVSHILSELHVPQRH